MLKAAAPELVPDAPVLRYEAGENLNLMSTGKPLVQQAPVYENIPPAQMEPDMAQRIVSGPTTISDARMNQILANPDSMTEAEADAILSRLG